MPKNYNLQTHLIYKEPLILADVEVKYTLTKFEPYTCLEKRKKITVSVTGAGKCGQLELQMENMLLSMRTRTSKIFNKIGVKLEFMEICKEQMV